MRSSNTAATTPPWARLGAPSNAGPNTVRDTASSPSRKNWTSRPMGLASPDTTQSGKVPIGEPSGGRSNMCCFMVSTDRLRPRADSIDGSHSSIWDAIVSKVAAGTS